MDAFPTSPTAALFQLTGAALSIGLSSLGAAIATGSLGSQILNPPPTQGETGTELKQLIQKPGTQSSASTAAPDMKKLILVIMAGILAIYGLMMAILIVQSTNVSVEAGISKFAAGLAVGGASLASGYGMSRLKLSSGTSLVSTIIVMMFLESLGLYGMIVGLIINNTAL
eukprot:TRINITY_DN11589_c0_g1_i1.p1 TRINITY_DN11589_c0_g1~~TRINITY_DN11589_c0_g1_i1.p1  ORF type:complete len:170 (+),score=45.87 TRINITY_DN11589_c0_g1_i1:73-582(+)